MPTTWTQEMVRGFISSIDDASARQREVDFQQRIEEMRERFKIESERTWHAGIDPVRFNEPEPVEKINFKLVKKG